MFFEFAYAMLTPRLGVGINSARDLQRKYGEGSLSQELEDYIKWCRNQWFND